MLSVPIPSGLDASDENEWYHFQGHSLVMGFFSEGQTHSTLAIAEWKPSLSGVDSDKISMEVCDLWMNV